VLLALGGCSLYIYAAQEEASLPLPCSSPAVTMQTAQSDVTELLQQWSNGDGQALDRLVPLVYEHPAVASGNSAKPAVSTDCLRWAGSGDRLQRGQYDVGSGMSIMRSGPWMLAVACLLLWV
jgi:hypothetical protein